MQLVGFSFAELPFHRFVFAIAIALCFAQVSSSSNETDKSALLEFKAGITEDPLGVLSSWNDTISFCRWYGVTCSRRHHNRVTVLDLSSQKLSGSISPHIGDLSFLRKLWLINNSFHQEIPSQIGRLHRLRFLSLSNNSLTGEIPKNTSGCLNLLVLGMSNNQLNGEVPPEIGSLVKLRTLFLGANHLTGSVPSSIGNLSSLEDLYLEENYLGGSLPEALGQLTKLTTLALGGNRFSGTVPPSLYNLSSLVSFDVGYNNQIQGSLPTTIGFGLPNLEFFSIQSNRFVGSIPLSISNNATNLRILQLGMNELSGNVPSFESLRNLRWLTIYSNHLGSGGSGDLSFLCSLTNITSLTVLSVAENRLGGFLPECIGNLSINMTWLALGMNPIFGEIPKTIGNLVNLEVLWMENKLSGAIPYDVGNLQSLVTLNLRNNNLSGLIPSSLQKMKKLLRLYLDGNHFYGHIPSHLDKCQNLMELNLANNNLSGSIFPTIKTLLFLNLSHNHLSGSLPTELGQIDRLSTLDISGNMFGGEIPSTLGDCDGLEVLKMKDNHFQGSIPQSFRSLRGIKELDLSNNNLSGEIPKFLEAFHFLEILNLSYNNFEGKLPSKGVFKNVSAAFIDGNHKICGGIPEFRLPKCISRHPKGKGVYPKLTLLLSIIFGLVGGVLVLVLVCICWLKKKKAQEPTLSSIADTWQNLSYGTLLKATDGFSSTNLIGVGNFGSVYKGILQENGTSVAVKVLNLTHHGALKSFKAECEALKLMKHRNLLKVLTICSSIDYDGNDFKALVYELKVNGSLEEWLHPSPILADVDGPSKNLSLIHRIKISIDVAFALDYLHNQCHGTIIHCDLKPSNVLLDADMVGHVGDFGLAKIILESTCNANANISSIGLRGTIGYVAPEYGMGSAISVEGDVYSYGILLLEMFTGISPTSKIFKENSSLRNFVEEALPERALEITDPFLVQEVENDAGHSRKNTVQDCLLMIYGIGIACSVGVPRERMRITDVAAQLVSIRDRLYTAGY